MRCEETSFAQGHSSKVTIGGERAARTGDTAQRDLRGRMAPTLGSGRWEGGRRLCRLREPGAICSHVPELVRLLGLWGPTRFLTETAV